MVAALNNPNNQGAITSGTLPSAAGMAIMEYPAIPTANNQIGFAGHRNATVLVCRPPKNPEQVMQGARFPGANMVITEPTTGLSVLMNEWIDTDLTCHIRLCWMYGVAVGNAVCGQRLITS